MMNNDKIDYEELFDCALRTVVREALKQVAKSDSAPQAHLYISFNTFADGVELSQLLREQFPGEMTIVLQNQFWNLQIAEDHFCVTLNFNKIPSDLIIPFSALTGFVDKHTSFSLQFGKVSSSNPIEQSDGGRKQNDIHENFSPEKLDQTKPETKVVALDTFRKR